MDLRRSLLLTLTLSWVLQIAAPLLHLVAFHSGEHGCCGHDGGPSSADHAGCHSECAECESSESPAGPDRDGDHVAVPGADAPSSCCGEGRAHQEPQPSPEPSARRDSFPEGCGHFVTDCDLCRQILGMVAAEPETPAPAPTMRPATAVAFAQPQVHDARRRERARARAPPSEHELPARCSHSVRSVPTSRTPLSVSI